MLSYSVYGFLILGSHQISSASRFSLSLDGVWKFRLSPVNGPDAGFKEGWYKRDFPEDEHTLDMPVPSSFNDIPTEPEVRDFVGWVWYQRSFSLPHHIDPKKTYGALRFGSAQYFAQVWINENAIGYHEGGHIPFEFDVTELLSKSTTEEIRLTVAVNNTLNPHTIPQGSLSHVTDKDNFTYITYTHNFDYFDYAGLNGNVKLLFKPSTHVSTVEIQMEPIHRSNIQTATVQWNVKYENLELLEKPNVRHTIFNPQGKVYYRVSSTASKLRDIVTAEIENPELWWPRSSFAKAQPGFMYTLQIEVYDGTELVDTFWKKFGIRFVEVSGTDLLVNGEVMYLKGFGMHQDAEIRGRGFDPVHLVRDFNLLKWSGANAIRTSHYPYPEEFLEMADKYGIMVILEAPACSLSTFDEKLLNKHKEVLTEMRKVYGNHPSVIMWSLANEPQSNDVNSTKYFDTLIKHMKSLDPSRPVTFVTSQQIENEIAAQNVDVICLNRYQGWYSLGGRLDLIQHHVTAEIKAWKNAYKKPVILTEYGAESLSGYHSLPSTMWTENYQIELLHEHFKGFDALRQEGALAGEMIWNFADFKVPQEYFRAEFCEKGIFTRNRQPKSAAYTVKLRYENLTEKKIRNPTSRVGSNYDE